MNDSFYYLTCVYENEASQQSSNPLDFKILIQLTNESLKIKPGKASQSKVDNSLQFPSMDASVKNKQPQQPSLSRNQMFTNAGHINQARKSYQSQLQQQQQQQQQQLQNTNQKHFVEKEIVLNQIKIKVFFSFNHSSFQNRLDLIKALINEFDQHLNQLINSVYLMLTLREIHDTRKWNSFLNLKETTSSPNSGCDASINNSFMRNSHESSDESVMTQRNETWIENVRNSTSIQTKLNCECVWNALFKLHRLHQTVQKKHGATDLTPSASLILPQQQQQQLHTAAAAQQQFISQGLNKLQDSLVNFRIAESNSGDLYVYTKKNEIFLLKLEEVYEVQATQINSGEAAIPVPNDMNPLSNNQGESSLDLSASYAKSSNTNSQQSSAAVKLMNSNITRRPSFASMDDTDRGKFLFNKSLECLV